VVLVYERWLHCRQLPSNGAEIRGQKNNLKLPGFQILEAGSLLQDNEVSIQNVVLIFRGQDEARAVSDSLKNQLDA
jgi:hypothetical protein